MNCSSLANIKIPEGLTRIGRKTFSCCTSLTTINIPSSVTSIGIDAFKLCSSLANIKIPEGLTSIGTSAFAGCNQLKITCANENQKNRLVKSGVNEDKITVISAQSRDATPFQLFAIESSGHGSDNDEGFTIL